MEGGGTRMGSRSSTRHGPATVFNGPVRRWRKTWSPVSATSVSLSSSRMQQYRWMPQGPKEDNSEDASSRAVKYLPLFVVVERRKDATTRVADARNTTDQQEAGLKARDVAPEGGLELGSSNGTENRLQLGQKGEIQHKDFGSGQIQNLTQGDADMFSDDSEGSEN